MRWKYRSIANRTPQSGGSPYDELTVNPADLNVRNYADYWSVRLYVQLNKCRRYVGRIELRDHACGICRDTHYDAWDRFGNVVEPDNGYGFNGVMRAAEAVIGKSPWVAYQGKWISRREFARLERQHAAEKKRWRA